MDFVTGLPPSGPDHADTMMVITDRLSKSKILKAMTTIMTEVVAECLFDCLIRHHEIPLAIVSDRGPQFVSHMWKRICKLLRIT